LPISLAQGVTALAHLSLVPLGQPLDKAMRVGHARRLNHLVVGGIQPAVADIVHHRSREEEGVLWDDADLLTQALLGHRAHIVPVYPNRPFLDIVEAGQQVDDGRLARASRTDERYHHARLDRQRYILEHRLALHVPEADVVVGDASLNWRQVNGVGGIHDRRRRIEQLKDAFGTRQAGHDLRIKVGQLMDRLVEAAHVGQKSHDHADGRQGRREAQHEVAAIAHNDGRGSSAEDVHHGHVQRSQRLRLNVSQAVALVDGAKLGHGGVLTVEGLHLAYAGNVLLEFGAHLADRLSRLPKGVAGSRRKDHCYHDHHG